MWWRLGAMGKKVGRGNSRVITLFHLICLSISKRADGDSAFIAFFCHLRGQTQGCQILRDGQ